MSILDTLTLFLVQYTCCGCFIPQDDITYTYNVNSENDILTPIPEMKQVEECIINNYTPNNDFIIIDIPE